MKQILNYIFWICLLVLSYSCAETDILTYGEANYIYFEDVAGQGETFPSRDFTFIFEDPDLDQITLQIPVKVTGRFTGADRSFDVIVEDTSSAVEGTHYTILTEANAIVNGETGGMLNILLNRTEDLEDNEVSLVFTFEENDHFRPGENKTFILRFSDFFTEPCWWMYPGTNDFYPNIGPFTQVKAGYWLEFHGIEDGSDPWCCTPYWDGVSWNETFGYRGLNSGYSLAAEDVAAFILWLQSLETENGAPLLDENGDRILNTLVYDESLPNNC